MLRFLFPSCSGTQTVRDSRCPFYRRPPGFYFAVASKKHSTLAGEPIRQSVIALVSRFAKSYARIPPAILSPANNFDVARASLFSARRNENAEKRESENISFRFDTFISLS